MNELKEIDAEPKSSEALNSKFLDLLKDDNIPKIPNELIRGRTGGYDYFLNPRGHRGVVVLFGEALEIFNMCQKGLNIAQIRKGISGLKCDSRRFKQIVAALGKSEMITINESFSQLLKFERLRNKKKRMMVWLQLTDSCNLNCGYCYIEKHSTRMNLKLMKDLVVKIADDCRKAGFDEVIFKLAGGEPVLCWADAKLLIDWVENYLPNSTPKIKFHLITNGTFLPLSLIEYAALGKIGVSVSLDGVEKWHNKHRFYRNGRGSFKDVDRTINELLSCKISPYILTTVTNDNAEGLTELVKYCVQHSLGFRFSFYRETPTSPSELKNDNYRLIQELSKCYGWLADNLPEKSLYQMHRFGDMNLCVPKVRACGIGTNGLTITSGGKICICQYEMSNPIGDALKDNSVQIMGKQNHYDLFENRVDKIPVCRDCEWKFICGGGCPFLTKRHYGTFLHYSPYCQVYKNMLPILTEIHAIQTIKNYLK